MTTRSPCTTPSMPPAEMPETGSGTGSPGCGSPGSVVPLLRATRLSVMVSGVRATMPAASPAVVRLSVISLCRIVNDEPPAAFETPAPSVVWRTADSPITSDPVPASSTAASAARGPVLRVAPSTVTPPSNRSPSLRTAIPPAPLPPSSTASITRSPASDRLCRTRSPAQVCSIVRPRPRSSTSRGAVTSRSPVLLASSEVASQRVSR